MPNLGPDRLQTNVVLLDLGAAVFVNLNVLPVLRVRHPDTTRAILRQLHALARTELEIPGQHLEQGILKLGLGSVNDLPTRRNDANLVVQRRASGQHQQVRGPKRRKSGEPSLVIRIQVNRRAEIVTHGWQHRCQLAERDAIPPLEKLRIFIRGYVGIGKPEVTPTGGQRLNPWRGWRRFHGHILLVPAENCHALSEFNESECKFGAKSFAANLRSVASRHLRPK